MPERLTKKQVERRETTLTLHGNEMFDEEDLLRLLDALEAAEAELSRLHAELAEYKLLFELQCQRMNEATLLWRAESPKEGALTSTDLGDLLTWLIERGK